MADVRSLLRQQQAARRITHPHAQYSESGKLSCSLCRESVKTEALWEAHVRSASHRQVLQGLAAAREREREAGPSTSAKRKLDVDEDEDEMMDETIRKKRSRAEIASPQPQQPGAASDGERSGQEQTLTPLSRRTSNTPVQGVEMKIPSRPATPMAIRDSVSSASTPNTNGDHFSKSHISSQRQPQQQQQQQSKQTPAAAGGQIDESEWAAFEADIAAATAPYSEDAVISAPAMPAGAADAAENPEEVAAPADKEIEAEREDATRALEEEFEEMEELEARARRLKEKREALRLRAARQDGGGVKGDEAADAQKKPSPTAGKENLGVVGEEDEEEEDEEEYEEDDYAWGGLRYAGRA